MTSSRILVVGFWDLLHGDICGHWNNHPLHLKQSMVPHLIFFKQYFFYGTKPQSHDVRFFSFLFFSFSLGVGVGKITCLVCKFLFWIPLWLYSVIYWSWYFVGLLAENSCRTNFIVWYYIFGRLISVTFFALRICNENTMGASLTFSGLPFQPTTYVLPSSVHLFPWS